MGFRIDIFIPGIILQAYVKTRAGPQEKHIQIFLPKGGYAISAAAPPEDNSRLIFASFLPKNIKSILICVCRGLGTHTELPEGLFTHGSI
jgi:hypothetical protein